MLASDGGYNIPLVREAESRGDTTLTTPFGAGKLTWKHAPDRWCRYCGQKGHVWRSIGDDYYHGETTACTACERVDCCWQDP